MTTSVSEREVPPAASPARIAVAVVLAAVVASIGNVLVALAMGAVEGTAPPAAGYLTYTVVGVLVGVVGWVLIRRFAPRPAAVLRVVVPVVVLLSFVPDLMLLQQGATVSLAVGLMVMHVVVAVPTVLALRRVLPV